MSGTALQERRHRFTRKEYDQIAGRGGFRDQRVELIDGEVIDKLPQNGPHATPVQLVPKALEHAFGPGFCVRAQLPLALDDHSEPEPDVAVVKGSPRDYRDAHPTNAVLVVEVADTSLAYDLEDKARIYARAGIPEYWVLDLITRTLRVHRSPGLPSAGEARYQDRESLGSGARVPLTALPGVALEIDDLLP